MRGSATAIRAIADGKIVARSICKYLGLNSGINQGADVDRPDRDEIEWNSGSSKPMPNLLNIERIKSNAEVAIGISEEQVKYEATRCNHCNGKASVDATRCIDCQMCWEMCPHGAITMVPLEQDKYLKAPPIKPEQYDQLFDICYKAKLMPMDFCCVCTFTLAEEIVSCILNGAHTVEDIAAMCGIRGGCAMYCTTKILRLLTAAGYPQTSREDGGWYDVEIGLTTLTDEQIAGCDPVFNLEHERNVAWSDELFKKNVEIYKMIHAPKEEVK